MSLVRGTLEIRNLSKSFGGLQIISDLNFEAKSRQATALIGPNGAGKTTVFNLICGVFQPSAGQIFLSGSDITDVPSYRRTRYGLARSFQNVRLMSHLTVIENLMVGQHVRAAGLLDFMAPIRLTRTNRWRREAREALANCGLDRYAEEAISSLPYGVRKRIDLIRATQSNPSVLLLDEPAAGLNPTERNALQADLEALKDRGVTLVVVEHDMHFIGQICDNVVVLNFGKKIAEGTLIEIQNDANVRTAYLGTEEAH